VSRARVEAIPGVALGGEPETVAPGVQSLGYRIWGSGFGFSSRLGSDANGPGYRTSGGGGSVGVDRFFDPTFLAGAALTFTRSATSGIGIHNDTDTFGGAAYFWWNPYQGLEFEGLLGADTSNIDTRRLLTISGLGFPTRGSTDSLGFTAVGNAGYRFRFPTAAGEAFLKPFAGLGFASQDRDAYTEYGAFGPGLQFASKTFERSTANLGAAAGIDLAAGNGWVVRPEVRAAWSRYLSDPSPAVPVTLFGTPFRLRDPEPGRDGAVVAAEITAISAGLQVFVGYAGEFRSNATAHQGRAGLRLTW
jgi:outer membrane autotransporter protein